MTALDVTGGSDDAGLAEVPAGMTAAPSGASGPPGPEAGWRRLSRRSMVVRPLTDLVRLLPLLAGLVLLHAQTGAGLAWGAVALVFAVVTGLVHWATTRYLITEERVYLRRGLLNQKALPVAGDRIRTGDVTAPLLHRLLGVCRVSIGTGRNDLRSGESFRLDGITRSEAESLRVMLLAVGAGVAPVAAVAPAAAAAPVDKAEATLTRPEAAPELTRAEAGPAAVEAHVAESAAATEIVRLRLSWLRFAPLTMTGLVVLGVLFGGVIQVTNATDINLAATDPVRQIVADLAALSVVHRILSVGARASPPCRPGSRAGHLP